MKSFISTGLLVGILAAGCGQKNHEVDGENDDSKNSQETKTQEGTLVGNGGDAIICKQSNGTETVQFYDSLEASYLYDLKIDLENPELPAADLIEVALKRLAKTDAKRAEELRREVKITMDGSRLLEGAKLQEVADEGLIIIPKNCRLEQLAIQVKPSLPLQKFVFINKDLYDHMSEFDKVALIFHETVYREAYLAGAKDSRLARYYNALILSKGLVGRSLEDYAKTIAHTGFPIGLAPKDWNIDFFKPLAFHDNQALKTGTVKDTGGKVSAEIGLWGGLLAEFYNNGSPKKITACVSHNKTAEDKNINCPTGMTDPVTNKTNIPVGVASVDGGKTRFSFPALRGAFLEFFDNAVPKAIYWNAVSFPSMDASNKVFFADYQTDTIGKQSIVYFPNNEAKDAVANESAIKFYDNGVPEFIPMVRRLTMERSALGDDLKTCYGSLVVPQAMTQCYDLKICAASQYVVTNSVDRKVSIRFHKNGRVKEISTPNQSTDRKILGAKCKLKDGTSVDFNETLNTDKIYQFDEQGFYISP